MKKLLTLMLALVLSLSSIATYSGFDVLAKANTYDAGDEYFLEFISSDVDEEDINFSHTPLYNADLEESGREYIFTVDGQNGYALMTQFSGETQTFYEIEELFFNKTSPFASCLGLPVYITHNTYLEYKDQAFFDLSTGVQVSDEQMAEYVFNGFNYFGGGTATFTNTTFTISYARKTTVNYSIQYDLPNINGSFQNGSCAHTAGAIILVYWDRFCENIIPNFEPMSVIGPFVVYKTITTEIEDLGFELIELMQIGEPHEGTTFSEFQLGMETLVERQGYTYTTTNLFSGGSFNFNNYKNSVENNIPVALFLSDFNMLDGILEGDGIDTIGNGYCPVSHVTAACGYKIDTYYDEKDNVIQTRNYIKVASGLISYGIGYLNINGVTSISKAISIQVS